jgi:hypothetical protein
MGIYINRDVRPNRHHSCSTCPKSMISAMNPIFMFLNNVYNC